MDKETTPQELLEKMAQVVKDSETPYNKCIILLVHEEEDGVGERMVSTTAMSFLELLGILEMAKIDLSQTAPDQGPDEDEEPPWRRSLRIK